MRRFEDLSGYEVNLAAAHELVARAYTSSVLMKRKQVLGVVLLGGAARGYADELSEIDLSIFFSKRRFGKIPSGEHIWRGYLLDNDLYVYRNEIKAQWSQEKRQAFSEGKILFEKRKQMTRLLGTKLALNAAERRNVIIESLLFFEDRIEDADVVWPKRGHLPSAHYALNRAVEYLLRILYAYNHKFLPGDKWRLYYSYHLPWLPRGYPEHMSRAMTVRNLTRTNLRRRVLALKRLDQALRRRLNQDRILPRNVYRYCVEKLWTRERNER